VANKNQGYTVLMEENVSVNDSPPPTFGMVFQRNDEENCEILQGMNPNDMHYIE